MVQEILPSGEVIEYDSGDESKVDHPDPPRDPQRTGGSGRPREKALGRLRIRFNWDEPNEDKQYVSDLTSWQKTKYNSLSSAKKIEYLEIMEDSEGLAPGQSAAIKYKVRVEQRKTGGSWQPVEEEYTKNNYFTYHAVSDTADITAEYRALIWSVDREGIESIASLNSNNGGYKLLKDGSGNENVIQFSYPGVIPAPKTFETGWTADKDYRIVKVKVRAGIHDESTHNTATGDGCPKGGALFINIRKYDDDDIFQNKVFSNDERLKIPAGQHKDIAWAEDMGKPKVFKDWVLAVSVTKATDNTYTGRGLVVSIVLEPI